MVDKLVADEKIDDDEVEDLNVEDVYGELNEETIDVKEVLESVKLKETEEDIIKTDTGSEVDDLYKELTDFIKLKTDIVPETGIKNTIPTGIDLLDAVLGGGFVIGDLSIIVGTPGSGKSMLAIQTMANAQKIHKGKMLTAFLDSEHATTTLRMSNLGVKYPKLKPYSDITIEKVFKFLEGMCLFKADRKIINQPSVMIWDSIANTLSQKERETDDPNTVIGYKARLLSILVPKYVAKVAEYNIAWIAVNQLRETINIGQFTPAPDLKFMTGQKSMPGGQVLKYNAFHLLDLRVKSVLAADKYGFDGILCKAKCVKNKLFPPNVEINIAGSFISGFSNFWTNYIFLVDTKRLHSSSWNYLINLPDKKFRTKDALTLYNSDQVFKDAFDEIIKEAIQTDIVERYNPEI